MSDRERCTGGSRSKVIPGALSISRVRPRALRAKELCQQSLSLSISRVRPRASLLARCARRDGTMGGSWRGSGDEVPRLGEGCGVSQGHVRCGQRRLLRVRVVPVTRLRVPPPHGCTCALRLLVPSGSVGHGRPRCQVEAPLLLRRAGTSSAGELPLCSRRSAARCRRRVRRWRVGTSRRSSARARRRVRILESWKRSTGRLK